ncbi:MAG TPA: hypothetical protein PKA88_25100, partial [Polyangiaceae bacterium]|nr:hypothetical protein [Polyangiaceae bacterium]
MLHRIATKRSAFLALACAFFACDSADDGASGAGTRSIFESDAPDHVQGPGGWSSGIAGTHGDAGAPSGGTGAISSGGVGGGAPGVKVGDAGLTQIDNERLYTLSRYSGLSVLDVTKADVKNLGHFSLVGAPFELYVNKGMAYAIYSAFPASLSAVPPDQKSGGVVVIDAKTPSAIKVTSVFEVDG